jgi:hypothetical protein
MTLNIEPLLSSIEELCSGNARADRASLLAGIRDQLHALQAADEKSRTALEQLCEMTSVDNAATPEAERAALTARENERAIAKKLIPRILSFQRYLTGTCHTDDPEAHEVLEEAMHVMIGYLAGYPDARDRLIRGGLKGTAPNEVLRARPTEGEIDYPELIREHMERYPKIRAALAK